MKVTKVPGGDLHREIYDAVNADLPVESIELTPGEWETWTNFLIRTGRRSRVSVNGKDMLMFGNVPIRRGK